MNTISCKINMLPHVGSSYFQYKGTISYCTITHPIDTSYNTEDTNNLTFDIRYHDENQQHKNMIYSHYQSIIKTIIEKVVLPYESNKLIVFRFNIVNYSEYSLMCAINSCLLAMIDIGIPIKMFYAHGSNDCIGVFTGDGIIYEHSLNNKCVEESLDVNNVIQEYLKNKFNQRIFK